MLDGARLTAYDVLDGVSSRAAYANLLLPQLLRERQLDERDAAFATQLAYGTLRAQGTLDAILTGLVSRPLAELDPRVLDLLRLGAYQLIDLRVPSHAAVDTTVDLTRAIVGTGASGLVNAVLRKVADRRRPRAVARARSAATGDERLALATDHPRWIVDAWRDALAATPSSRPRCWPTTPRPRCTWSPGAIDRDALVEESGGEPGPWSPFAVRLHGGDPGRLPSVRSGAAAVQDEGSQLAALLLARAPLEGPDAAWLDMCAGPGGKAGLLAAVRPDGVRLTAADRAPHRAELVRPGAGRRGRRRGARRRRHASRRGRRLVRPGAARRAVHRPGRAAPPSGGALAADAGRRPAAGRAADGAAGQRAARRCGVGGVVAYVTCSPHTAETVGGGRRGRRPGRRRGAARWRRCSRRCRTWRAATTGSCGRTGTAPTRCSWPCSAAPADGRRQSGQNGPSWPPPSGGCLRGA